MTSSTRRNGSDMTDSMWKFEIDPDALPSTPWRSYRLYTEDGAVVAAWYSVENGMFKAEGRMHPHDKRLDKTADEVRGEIAECGRVFGLVTLRALREPAN